MRVCHSQTASIGLGVHIADKWWCCDDGWRSHVLHHIWRPKHSHHSVVIECSACGATLALGDWNDAPSTRTGHRT